MNFHSLQNNLKALGIALICLVILSNVKASELDTLVVLFGDSITAGINVPNGFINGIGNGSTEFGPPDMELNKLLIDSRRAATVVNWGYGSTTSGPSGLTGFDGVGRIQSNLLTSKAQYPASQNIVLIMYGTNDYSQQLKSTDTYFYIREMISKARAVGFTPVIATIPNRVNEEETIPGRNFAIKLAASDENAPLVDVYQAIVQAGGDNLLYDGIHPSLEGYQVIAQAWFDNYLEGAIEQQPLSITPIISLLLDED